MSQRLFFLPLAAGLACSLAAATAYSQEPLTLERAQQLAVNDQPLLQAQSAGIEAKRARAVAAGQLPDPEVQFAVNELPANTDDAWSFRRDGDTDVMIGLMQEYPRAAKRRLRRLREEASASRSEQDLLELARLIRRSTGLAYADVYFNQRALDLATQQLAQTQLQQEAARIRFTTGTGPQSELLAAGVEAAALRDKVAEYEQVLAHERITLSRWIGVAASGEIPAAMPTPPAPPPLERVLSEVASHPALLAQEQAKEFALRGLDLAKQEYKPDWRIELGYGYRPEFSEMVTLRVAVDLPLFTRNRQDREAAAARQDIQAAAAEFANRARELAAEAAVAHHNLTRYRERLEAYREDALPSARARVEAAESAYRSASGSLADALLARRALLDTELQLLTLSVEALRSRIQLDYYVSEGERQ